MRLLNWSWVRLASPASLPPFVFPAASIPRRPPTCIHPRPPAPPPRSSRLEAVAVAFVGQKFFGTSKSRTSGWRTDGIAERGHSLRCVIHQDLVTSWTCDRQLSLNEQSLQVADLWVRMKPHTTYAREAGRDPGLTPPPLAAARTRREDRKLSVPLHSA